MNKKNYISLANKAANIQISELKKIKKVFNNSYIQAVDLILNCKGKVILAGIGKSGLIEEKFQQLFQALVFQVSFVILRKLCMVIWDK